MEKLNIIETHWAQTDRAIIATSSLDAVVEIEYPKRYQSMGCIWNLWVNADQRNKGVGVRLLDAAIEHIKARGCKIAVLDWCSLDTPKWVLEWYDRYGFKEIEFSGEYVRLQKNI